MSVFFSSLDIARTSDTIAIPSSWEHDVALDFEARGARMFLLSWLEPGVEMTAEQLDELTAPHDPPIMTVVPRLIDAGYLQVHGADRFELVHPGRLQNNPPDQSAAEGELVLLRDELMLLDEVMGYRCVARTTRRRRCMLPVEDSQITGWSYIMRPGRPQTVRGVYDLSRADDDKVRRWRNQHCPRHDELDTVTDFTAPEWRPFDPSGFVWAYQDPNRGWIASIHPASAPAGRRARR